MEGTEKDTVKISQAQDSPEALLVTRRGRQLVFCASSRQAFAFTISYKLWKP